MSEYKNIESSLLIHGGISSDENTGAVNVPIYQTSTYRQRGLGTFDSFLLIRGIKTLSVRLDRHVENAEKAAKFLSSHKAVKKVYYPGLPGAQGYEINKKQAKNGGAMISFELYENYDIKKFFKSLKLVQLAERLGGVESLVCRPAAMTHAAIPYEVRRKIGITDRLIRLSIGIESIDDILADIDRAIVESEA